MAPQDYWSLLSGWPPVLRDEHVEMLRLGFQRYSEKMNGFVYLCAHEAWPDKFKIGKTRKEAALRVKELSTAGVLGEHALMRHWWHYDASRFEATIHRALAEWREPGSEWFSAPLATVIETIERLRAEDFQRLADVLAS